MSVCGYRSERSDRTCQRPVTTEHDRCVFHLTPAEREEAGIGRSTLRDAFLADVDAPDPARKEYVDVHLDALDLSALVVDGSDVDRIRFRGVTVDGTLDLSGAVVRHPVTIEDSDVGQFETSGASFEMDVIVAGTRVGRTAEPTACFRARRGTFERSLELADVDLDGPVEFAACRVRGWLEFDDVTVGGRAHFQNLSFERAQFVSTAFEGGAELVGATGDRGTFDGVRVGDGGALDLSDGSFGSLRVVPAGGFACRLEGTTVAAGRLDQPDAGTVHYDLTDATVGDVDLDFEAGTFERYRFYRTRFDGFRFASYREVWRANRWQLHDFTGEPAVAEGLEGLEHTYLEAKQGASGSGDSETASMFFVRELRYRRRRYAAHARTSGYAPAHRVDAAVRWLTNGFLDAVAGYGERPQRTAALSLVVILVSAVVYPAAGGLSAGTEVVRYGSHGPMAALDGLYFSAVTFATLGLGDVHPVGDVGRIVAAAEGLAGAFLTAVFVFSLGRRVTR